MVQLPQRHLQHPGVQPRHVHRGPAPAVLLEVDVPVPQRARVPIGARVRESVFKEGANFIGVTSQRDGVRRPVGPQVDAVGEGGGGALVYGQDAVHSRELGLVVGVLLPVAVAERELGEEGVVDGAYLAHVLGSFRGADERGPRGEIRRVRAHLVPQEFGRASRLGPGDFVRRGGRSDVDS